MSSPAIDKYYTSVQKNRDYGGSGKETAIRSAFYTLLNHLPLVAGLLHLSLRCSLALLISR